MSSLLNFLRINCWLEWCHWHRYILVYVLLRLRQMLNHTSRHVIFYWTLCGRQLDVELIQFTAIMVTALELCVISLDSVRGVVRSVAGDGRCFAYRESHGTRRYPLPLAKFHLLNFGKSLSLHCN